MPIALYALTVGAFGIGVTEFIIMGLLLQVSADLGVSIPTAGLLMTGYALGVFVGAPILTLLTRRLPRKTTLLVLMAIFTVGNALAAIAPTYGILMAARLVTALAHGTFFGVGSLVAVSLVAPERKASAISIMFTGLTIATLLGVPFGAWLGLAFGWRMAFWAVAGVGALAFVVLAALVPAAQDKVEPAPLREEFAVLARPQVQLGLLMTVLGFGGVFAVFTYIQPILTELAGFSKAAVSPILLVFGAGLVGGNLVGGRWADKGLNAALVGTLAALTLVMAGSALAFHSQVGAVIAAFLLGAAAFATVAPLQMRVLSQAGGAGQGLASSLNIAAFNLGNAFGAWLGGAVIAHGPGLSAIPLVAAAVPLSALALAGFSLALERRAQPSIA
ncbi:MFS transporter [Caulobacter vibrioides]|jgi:DHA1 family inner membrane transport protein|uniref:Arabinose efflux permease family protein n=1 Tax=Caulobacter vibrioides OR37 TaxID=1292034 RepID=R0ED45_CAUVI|nr:MFS transporter [Caulobacter vibrioides]ENZ83373.1 arabinose efflux permease family protein [Caulobacter vibrioides OR37]